MKKLGGYMPLSSCSLERHIADGPTLPRAVGRLCGNKGKVSAIACRCCGTKAKHHERCQVASAATCLGRSAHLGGESIAKGHRRATWDAQYNWLSPGIHLWFYQLVMRFDDDDNAPGIQQSLLFRNNAP